MSAQQRQHWSGIHKGSEGGETVMEANSHGRIDEQGTTWAAAKKIAQNRTRRKVTVNGLCSARNSED